MQQNTAFPFGRPLQTGSGPCAYEPFGRQGRAQYQRPFVQRLAMMRTSENSSSRVELEPRAATPVRSGRPRRATSPSRSEFDARLARLEAEVSGSTLQRRALAGNVAEQTRKLADMVAEACRDVGVYEILASRVDGIRDSCASAMKMIGEAEDTWQAGHEALKTRVLALEARAMAPATEPSSSETNDSSRLFTAEFGADTRNFVQDGCSGVSSGHDLQSGDRLKELEQRVNSALPDILEQSAAVQTMVEKMRARFDALEERLDAFVSRQLDSNSKEARRTPASDIAFCKDSDSKEFSRGVAEEVVAPIELAMVTYIGDVHKELSFRIDQVARQFAGSATMSRESWSARCSGPDPEPADVTPPALPRNRLVEDATDRSGSTLAPESEADAAPCTFVGR